MKDSLKLRIMSLWLCIILLLTARFCFSESQKISGYVRDSADQKPLAQANVTMTGSEKGCTTDANGRFELSSAQLSDLDTIKISFMGYRMAVIPAKDFKNDTVIFLDQISIPLPEIDVSAKRLEQMFSIEPSTRLLSSAFVEKIPPSTGHDIHRALQTLPGVTTANELSSHLNVRGGSFDQNLILLDGVAVYYPYHYLGLVSAFNADMIENAIFSQGGFSAGYGDRLSSVLGIITKKPVKNFPNRINLNIVGGDITVGNKIGNKLGWMISARSSYYDLAGKIIQDAYPFYYYDIFAKIEYEMTRHNQLNVFIYQNRDTQDIHHTSERTLYSSTDSDKKTIDIIDKDEIYVQNRLISLSWDNKISKKLNLTCQFSSSEYGNAFDKQKEAKFPENLDEKFNENRTKIESEISQENDLIMAKIENTLTDYTFKASSMWTPLSRVNLNMGIQFTHFDFNYGWNGVYYFWEPFVSLFFDYSPESFNFNRKVNQSSGYIESLWEINDKLRTRTGIRVTHWDFHSKYYFEPRLNIEYNLGKKLTLKLAYGDFTQGVSTCLEKGLIGFLELYFPNQYGDNVGTARHYIINLGYNHNDAVGFQTTLYYKAFKNLLQTVDGEQMFSQSDGSAFGFECEAFLKIWKLRNRMNSAWSHSRRSFNRVTYDTNFDQRHRIQISSAGDLGKGWSVSAYWILHSGQPYDPGRYLALYRGVDYLAFRNSRYYNVYGVYETQVPPGRIRYPYYHRLDISVSKEFKKKSITYLPYLAIRNVYFRNNVLYYRNLDYRPSGEDEKWVNPDIDRDPFVIPVLPTFGIKLIF